MVPPIALNASNRRDISPVGAILPPRSRNAVKALSMVPVGANVPPTLLGTTNPNRNISMNSPASPTSKLPSASGNIRRK